jgi:hypothetical protein
MRGCSGIIGEALVANAPRMRGMKALATAGAFAFLVLRQLFLVRPHLLDEFLFVYQNLPTTPDGDRNESVFSIMENQIAQSVFRRPGMVI